MSELDDDIARGCLPNGEPIDARWGAGYWSCAGEPEQPPEENKDEIITQLRAENAEMLEALERHVEWLENVDHDYSNGNSACGCDEGAVLGQRGESQLLASSHTILAKHTEVKK